eukprot:scaffold74378_cov71-Phaeocystis_antarctica.AAC.4
MRRGSARANSERTPVLSPDHSPSSLPPQTRGRIARRLARGGRRRRSVHPSRYASPGRAPPDARPRCNGCHCSRTTPRRC